MNYSNQMKKSKNRITILLRTSMSREKLDPLIIGHSGKPRCFKNVKTNPLKYEYNKKVLKNQKKFCFLTMLLHASMLI